MAVRTSFTAGEVLAAADLTDTFGAKANLASPTFTGTPAAPTAAAGTNTTQIATTAFVQSAGGLVLVSPTSIANSGGSASASGGAVTFTGVSSVSLNGVFTSAYDNYRIMFQDNALTGSGNATLRLRASGSDASGSDYFKVGIYASDANTPTRTLATASTSWMVFGLDAGNASDHPFIMDILFPQLTRRTRFAYQAIGSYSTNNFGYFETSMGSHNQAIAYDGFSLLFPSSITGTVRVYGYKNS